MRYPATVLDLFVRNMVSLLYFEYKPETTLVESLEEACGFVRRGQVFTSVNVNTAYIGLINSAHTLETNILSVQ